jgi:hypothetical protein
MTMKTLASILLFAAGLASAHAASAAADLSLAKQMEDCFRQHGHLMDKPAVRNVRACWMAHAYLMERH